jgi:hypothetical protein
MGWDHIHEISWKRIPPLCSLVYVLPVCSGISWRLCALTIGLDSTHDVD